MQLKEQIIIKRHQDNLTEELKNEDELLKLKDYKFLEIFESELTFFYSG